MTPSLLRSPRGNWFGPLRERGLFFLGLLFWVHVLAIMGLSLGRENNDDEQRWHLPAVRQIAGHWPSVDLVADSLSASPPGYHWLLAGISRVTGDGLTALRLANAVFAFLLIAMLYSWLRGRASQLDSTLLVAPLAASNFVLKSSAWVLTDNAGLLLATASLLAAMRVKSSPGNRIWASILAGLTLMVRHINAWILLPLFLRNLTLEKSSPTGASREKPRLGLDRAGLVGVLSLSIPGAVLLWLVASWGGLVPVQWRTANMGLSTCPQAFLFSMMAVFLPFFLSGDVIALSRWKSERRWVIAGALAGLCVSLATATSWSYEAGRWGGHLWSVVQRLPSVHERSIFFILMAPIGGAFVALLWRAVMRGERKMEGWIWGAAVVGWAVSLVVCRQVFHRYFEPTSLVLAAIGVALCVPGELTKGVRMRLGALTGLHVLNTLATVIYPLIRNR